MNVFSESLCKLVLPGMVSACEYLVKLAPVVRGTILNWVLLFLVQCIVPTPRNYY